MKLHSSLSAVVSNSVFWQKTWFATRENHGCMLTATL